MKKGMVFLVIFLLNVASVSAFAELRQAFVSVDEGLLYGHASVEANGEEDLRLTWFIPELDFRYRAGPYEDDDDFSVNALTPFDAPAGEYLVRVTLSNDDGRKVVYRYVTIE